MAELLMCNCSRFLPLRLACQLKGLMFARCLYLALCSTFKTACWIVFGYFVLCLFVCIFVLTLVSHQHRFHQKHCVIIHFPWHTVPWSIQAGGSTWLYLLVCLLLFTTTTITKVIIVTTILTWHSVEQAPPGTLSGWSLSTSSASSGTSHSRWSTLYNPFEQNWIFKILSLTLTWTFQDCLGSPHSGRVANHRTTTQLGQNGLFLVQSTFLLSVWNCNELVGLS